MLRMDGVPTGYMRVEEVGALGKCAADMAEKFPTLDMLEIGAWLGRSTVAIAREIGLSQKKIRLHSIDPHEGFVDYNRTNVGPSHLEWLANVKKYKVGPFVSCIKEKAEDVDWNRPISLLFIDGLHKYKDIKHDFEKFEPFVVDGGLILVHDFRSWIWTEVKQYISKEVWPVLSTKRRKRFAQPGQFKKKERVRTMLVLEKIHG